MTLRFGSVQLALCAILIGTASAWALAPHDKAVGVKADHKADRAADAQVKAERDKADTTAAPTLVTPSQPTGQHGDAGQHSENREQEGTEFWPMLAGYKFKITDSLIALSTLALTVFTGLLWRSTEKLWTAGERQIGIIESNIGEQSRVTEESLRISREALASSTRSAEAFAESAALAHRNIILSQRPRVRVGNIWTPNTTDPPTFFLGGSLTGTFDFENIGGTNAYVTGADVMVHLSELGLPVRYPLGTRRLPLPNNVNPTPVIGPGTLTLTPGQVDAAPFSGVRYFNHSEVEKLNNGRGINLYVMGWMEYRDDLGIVRRMRFCREYDFVTRTYVRVSNTDYEYET